MRAAPSKSDALSWIEFPDGPSLDLIGSCTIGRAPDNLIRLSNDLASRQHALIHRQEQYEFWLVDLGSRNGTLLNETRLSQPVRLRDGDVIEIAGEKLTFRTRAFAPPKDQDDRSMDSTRFDVRQSCCWLMVADIVDSSKLARELPPEELPQVTGAWFKSCRRIIEKHGGSMSKYLGDGFLSYWIDSANASQQVVEAVQELDAMRLRHKPPFRVVVHRGQAVLRGVPTMSELNLHGPEVNFVFRMEKVAGRLGHSLVLSESASAALNTGTRTTLLSEESVSGFDGSFRFYSFDVSAS